MTFRWTPEPCTCNTDTPCAAKILRGHFKNTYFACSPVTECTGGPNVNAIERYLSVLTELRSETENKKDSPPPTKKILSKKKKSPDCITEHVWRKYGTKQGKGNIQREYYKCKDCDLRKRIIFDMDKKTKKMIEIDCQIGNKKCNY